MIQEIDVTTWAEGEENKLILFKYSRSNYFIETTYQEFSGKSGAILTCSWYDPIIFATDVSCHQYNKLH